MMMCLSQATAETIDNDRKRKFEDNEAEGSARIKLTAQEQRWARQLKAVLRETDGIQALSDWEYTGLVALGCLGDNMDIALQSVRRMQSFQRKHGILNCLKEGLGFVRDFVDKFSDVLLKIDRCGDDKEGQRYFAVVNMAAVIQCIISCMDSDVEYKSLLRSIYYLTRCLCPDIEGLRGGCTLIMECADVDWSEPMVAHCLAKLWLDLSGSFPFACKDVWFYNSTAEGAEALTLLGMQSFSEVMMQKMFVVCQMEVDGHQVSLKSLFSQPGEPGRSQDKSVVLQDAERLLEVSFRIAACFSL
jgi:hypothetical protein